MITNKWIKLYKIPILSILARHVILIKGADIPRSVKIGKNVSFPHNSIGTVIHPSSIIDDDVKIYQNVTIGKKNIYDDDAIIGGCHVCQGAIICAGAKICFGEKELVIGKNSIIAANAVLFESVGENEIWGGIPAKLIGYRK